MFLSAQHRMNRYQATIENYIDDIAIQRQSSSLQFIADRFQFTATLCSGLGIGYFKFVERVEHNL